MSSTTGTLIRCWRSCKRKAHVTLTQQAMGHSHTTTTAGNMVTRFLSCRYESYKVENIVTAMTLQSMSGVHTRYGRARAITRGASTLTERIGGLWVKCEVCEKHHDNKRFCSVKCRNSVIQKLAVIAKQKNMIKTRCGVCGVEKVTNSRARKFCSKQCYYISERIDLRAICLFCKTEFEQVRASGVVARRKFCSRSCACKFTAIGRIYEPWSEERRANHMKNMRRGESHPFWRGGVTPYQKIERRKPEYIAWRKAIFERDNYTCQLCGVRGGTLHADHIKSWIKYPDLRTELSNGRTLCLECHKKTPTYARNLAYQQ